METPSGTVYTPEYGEMSVGGPCRWYMDDTRHGDTDIPLLVFVHGSGGNVDNFGLPGWGTVRNRLIDTGWAVVEGDAGGINNWGGPVARTAYTEMVDWVESKVDVGPIAVLGQSMGGICAYWLATGSPFAGRVVGLAIQNGTTDLAHRYEVATDGVARVMNRAYGLGDTATKDYAAFSAASAGYDPMLFPTTVWEGKHVLQVWSLADAQVPPGLNGAAWVDKYGTHTSETRVHENLTGGHWVTGQDAQQHIAFLHDVIIPGDPTPPSTPPQDVHRVRGLYLVAGASRWLYPANFR